MLRTIYQHPTDQRLSSAVTITPSTEDPDYPKAGLYDSNPAKPFRFEATTGNIVFDFGSAVAIELVAIIHHNLTAGLEVRIQGNATDAWGAPSLNELIEIPAYEQDGFPVNPWIDLSELTNSFRYWRLSFPEANGSNIALGQVWLGATKRELVGTVVGPIQAGAMRRVIEHETDYSVSTIYDLGAKVRNWTLTLLDEADEMVAVEAWWDACHGRALPSLFILDGAVNDARLVRFAEQARTVELHHLPGATAFQFGLREVSRGLVL